MYSSSPYDVIDGIPIFSKTDRYVDNYKQIALDHLAVMSQASDNPFIENNLWVSLEQSTRVLIEEYVNEGARILDAGVGLGRVLEPLDKLQRYGIDISLDYLKKARDKGVNVAMARIENMPYEDEYFDAVVTCDVLEHVIDLHACTQQLLRVLKPRGHLIVRVPYREDLKVYLQEGLKYEFIHLRNFDEHSIRLFFEKIHGCEVLAIKTTDAYWQGETRLRYKLPPLGADIRNLLENKQLKSLGIDREGKDILKSISLVSEERLTAWINRIKQEAPALFKHISPYFILDIEMNVVVQKPF